MNLLIVGLPGSGKRTISKILREDFGYKVIEVEKILSIETGKDLCDLIRTYGFQKVARIEQKIIARFEKVCDIIVVSSGIICDFSSEKFLKIYLKSPRENFFKGFKNCSKANTLEEYFLNFHKYYSKHANLVISTEHKLKFEIATIISDFFKKNILYS